MRKHDIIKKQEKAVDYFKSLFYQHLNSSFFKQKLHVTRAAVFVHIEGFYFFGAWIMAEKLLVKYW